MCCGFMIACSRGRAEKNKVCCLVGLHVCIVVYSRDRGRGRAEARDK